MSENLPEKKELSPEEKRALLARLLKEKSTQSNTEHPVAYGQRGLWFIHQLAPESSAYHIAFTAQIPSVVDVPALKRALQYLTNRHELLRATFEQRDNDLVQVIHAYQDVYFDQVDASGWDEDGRYQALVEAHKQPFDLEHGPIIRWYLFTQSPTNHVLLLSVHHIVFDGYSTFILLEELKNAYAAEVAGQTPAFLPVKASYADFVRKQLDLMQSPEGERLKQYWLNQLSGELPTLNLPTDYNRPPVQTYNGASHEFTIPADITTRLKALAASENTTLYSLLLSIFQILLHRYTGQDDLLIGSPTSSRNQTEFGKTIGYFVDPVVLRSKTDGDPSFKTFLAQTRKTVLDALSHQDYPFMILVQQLSPSNDPSRSPLFQVMFNLQSLQRLDVVSSMLQKKDNDPMTLLLTPYHMPHEEGQFDLVFDIMEAGGELFCALKYNTDLYNAPTIVRMAQHYQMLAQGILANLESPISHLPLLTEPERHQLFSEWNATQADYPLDQSIHQLFEQQVARTPDAIVISSGNQQITYQSLNHRANQLAHHLRKLGVKNETLVGINMEASIDMIVAILSILKTGAAYVPLDSAYPPERLAYMVEDSHVSIVLTHDAVENQISGHNFQAINLDQQREIIGNENIDNLPDVIRPDTLAYVIYTSGSTGQPKGVMIEQHSLVNYIWWAAQAYLKGRVLDFPLFSSLSFDLTVTSIFTPLITGGQIVVYPEDNNSRGTSILRVIKDGLVDVVKLTPAHLNVIRDMDFSQTRIKVFIVGGEDFKTELARSISAAFNHKVEIYNEYGPTEATVGCMIHQFDPANDTGFSVSIGVPAHNARIYILDNQLNLVPIGINGEIYIAGDGLARGYLNRPELTAERFIINPFEPGKRLYKTGDIARLNTNGKLEYLGRSDQQVKIRGHRIELGEIETLLDQHPAVQKSVVIAREDVPGDKQLVAYMTRNEAQVADSPDFRAYLRDTLPDYMLPSAFVVLDTFPLTPNQKVDRKALPAPQRQVRPEIALQNMPTKPMEIILADIWRELLQVDSISVYDNFFDLGGHSLQVMQIVTRFETQTGLKIDPVTMRMQTLGQLASACELMAANPPVAPAENAPPKGLFTSIKRFVTGKQDKV